VGRRASELISARGALGEFAPISNLPGLLLGELDKIGRLHRYKNGSTVMSAGEVPAFVGVVVHGVLCMRKTLRDGRQQVVDLLMRDDLFGCDFGSTLRFDIEASSDAEVIALSRRSFKAVSDGNPELDRMVALDVLSKLDRARDLMLILANPRVRGRLAGFLVVLSARFDGKEKLVRGEQHHVPLKIPLGRVDLAQLLGTRTESISRAFHALANDGHILMRTPNEIKILDFEALLAEIYGDDLPARACLRAGRGDGRPRGGQS
jgi:CRP/FNR family transcriptional regulator